MSRHRRQQHKRARKWPRDWGFCPDWCFDAGFTYVPVQSRIDANGVIRFKRTKPIWEKKV